MSWEISCWDKCGENASTRSKMVRYGDVYMPVKWKTGITAMSLDSEIVGAYTRGW